MIVSYNDGEDKVFCDACGQEMPDENNFIVSMNYGSEDDCFGSCGQEYELLNEYGYDLRGCLAQETYHTCDNCRCNDSNFISIFEAEARKARTSLIRKLIETANFPGYMNEDQEREIKLKDLDEKLTKALADLAKEKSSHSQIKLCQLVADLYHKKESL